MTGFIDANFQREVDFLKALVRVPSDNPPGDCARHAQVAAQALEGLGFAVERHPVPDDLVRQYGMVSVTNLVIRETFGSGRGPVIALNAHGDVVSRAVMNALQNKPIRVFGDGSQTRSFLFVEDCVDGVRALENANTRGAPVNLAPESDTAVRALVGRIVDLSGSTSAVELSVDPVGPERGLFDVRRAKEFGFVAKTPLETGLAKTIEAYRASAPSVRPDGP